MLMLEQSLLARDLILGTAFLSASFFARSVCSNECPTWQFRLDAIAVQILLNYQSLKHF